MPNRGAGGVSYRYGFNGKETENDVKGIGNVQDYGMRIYDTRLGRWLSLDPIQKKYPELSPFQYVANNPVNFIDPDGKRIILSGNKNEQKEFVAKLEKMTGFKIEMQNDGNLKIIGDIGKPFAPKLRSVVFDLLDEKGKKYENDVLFKLVNKKSGFSNKALGKVDGKNTYVDQFYTGAFDMDDFRAMKNPIIAATMLAHVLAERAYVPNYKQYVERMENEELIKFNEEKDEIEFKNLEEDGVFNNAHLAGQILETETLAEFFDRNGKPLKLFAPSNGETFDKKGVGKIRVLRYGGVNISLISTGKNENNITNTNFEFPDSNIQPKKEKPANEAIKKDSSSNK